MTDNTPQAPQGEFVLFQAADGSTRVECRFEAETLWLTQAAMAELYQISPQAVTQHIKAVYEEGELDQNSTCKSYLQVAQEGSRQVSRNRLHYSLPVIIAVGYRVRSSRGTQFRKWATATLQEYLIKGFAMDDERLKNPPVAGSMVPDYFDEMLERIRDIRASERRMYLRVKDIMTMAADYEPSNRDTTSFFRHMQNKLHFASTGLTAAELIAQRVDAEKPNVGLTTFKGDEVRKADVTVAKNYLQEEEINALNRIVVMWLDFAEDQALQRKQVFLQDWQERLDQFLQFNNRDVLQGAGSISKRAADDKAKAAYDRYAEQRRLLKEKDGEAAIIAALEEQAKKKS
jgi:hypothetical protein